ncbi:MAG TPA: family 16 glycosylhydrolase [Fimbriimonas sp.]|nr:family 16 glycosylhydrolase [Fimbriimonas sp.]
MIDTMLLLATLLTVETMNGPKNISAPKWKLTFAQEFDGKKGDAPDPKVWSRDLGGGGFGNNEHQSYTDGNQNAFLDGNGRLVIEARKEKTKGADGIEREYSSARLKTDQSFNQTYGRFEARLKMPIGKGIWPAFWMLGANAKDVGWPRCGEIDIMEYLGHQSSTTYGTVHGPGYSGAAGISKGTQHTSPLTDDFHVYAVEWEPEEIRWYLDDKLFHTITPNSVGINDWVFNQPQFMILNLAVGGNWPGYPDANTTFPQRFIIDYVRVYTDENLVVDTEGIKKRDAERKLNGPKFVHPGPSQLPGTVVLADYKVEGGYHDMEPANQGGQYRLKDGVDIGASGAPDVPFSIGWTKAGEWLKYDIEVKESGKYTIEATVASEGDGGTFHLEVGGLNFGSKATVPNTGGWTNWKPISLGTGMLKAGKHTLVLKMDTDGATGSVGNLLSLKISK